jgi:glutamate synthase domain-containing protein 3
VQKFVKVMPKDLKRVMQAASQARSEGVDEITAVMAAAQG